MEHPGVPLFWMQESGTPWTYSCVLALLETLATPRPSNPSPGSCQPSSFSMEKDPQSAVLYVYYPFSTRPWTLICFLRYSTSFVGVPSS